MLQLSSILAALLDLDLDPDLDLDSASHCASSYVQLVEIEVDLTEDYVQLPARAANYA